VRGKWGKRFKSSRRSQGWSVLRKRGTEAACRRRTGAGGGAPRGGDGVPVARGQESSGEVARKLPQDDVVLVVCLAGTERQRNVGSTARPSGDGARAHRRGGPAALVREIEIGRVCEHQWVAAVLLEHWITGGRWQRRLTMANRGSGVAPARSSQAEEGRRSNAAWGMGKRS
jgi:hypothetical protein